MFAECFIHNCEHALVILLKTGMRGKLFFKEFSYMSEGFALCINSYERNEIFSGHVALLIIDKPQCDLRDYLKTYDIMLDLN